MAFDPLDCDEIKAFNKEAQRLDLSAGNLSYTAYKAQLEELLYASESTMKDQLVLVLYCRRIVSEHLLLCAIDKEESDAVVSSRFEQIRNLGFRDSRSWGSLMLIYCRYLLGKGRKGEARTLLRQFMGELDSLGEALDECSQAAGDLLKQCG